ncbi:ester cyclase [uncultured Draconibacterium sp.]|uniref:ester cyclase n=1 Tax=uncultured Draconibacterium sp. TaxID=1573823 RepID=UPI0029C61E27|nr:ester cyclase [uncultured Draconibacterium sp.]
MLETEKIKHLQESELRNRELIERVYDELWNKRNSAVLDECLSPNVVYRTPGTTCKGIEEYKQMYEMYASAFEKSHFEILDMIASNDKVVSRVLFTCVHTGDLAGIPASGKEVKMQAISICRIEHGKIVEEFEVFDELGMMQQIGMELHMKETVD